MPHCSTPPTIFHFSLLIFHSFLRQISQFFNFQYSIFNLITIFAPTSIAYYGFEGHNLIGKGRLRTLSSTSESRKFKSRRERNRSVHVGRIVPCSHYPFDVSDSTILHGVGYRVAYPGRGTARALMWDKRVEHPRLSFTLITDG